MCIRIVYTPANNENIENSQQLVETIKGQGENALDIFRKFWENHSAQVLGESATRKRDLIKALRDEVRNVQGLQWPRRARNETDNYLACIADGSYPITVGESDGSGDEHDESERVDGEARPRRGVEREAGGNESSQAPAGTSEILSMLKQIQESQAAMERRVGNIEQGRQRSMRKSGERRTLGAFLEEASGGKIRGRSGRQRDLSDESDGGNDSESDSVEEVPIREVSHKARFWANFKKIPFPVQTLRYERMEGEKMLRRALTNHPTVSAYVDSKVFKQLRNSKESRVLARSIDCMIDEFGIDKVKNSQAAEVLMRRLAAILLAERTGSWEAADELVSEDTDLLDDILKKRIRKSAKLAKEFAKKKSAREADGEK